MAFFSGLRSLPWHFVSLAVDVSLYEPFGVLEDVVVGLPDAYFAWVPRTCMQWCDQPTRPSGSEGVKAWNRSLKEEVA
ncbi:hypothetical protein DV706_18055 (plasmid) [Natronorubrum bangense]|uniref:Uncharacterized protein n=2 Tax=Natronorubrum bangense TaxID=61858 RepID=L9WC02_9EURY|nr:hypothetical protein C494_13846 [Natronorubrum bangense JCM 10635]QCC56431.1 hypothetical protein DV706_18055 [Natronorubrum bangense]